MANLLILIVILISFYNWMNHKSVITETLHYVYNLHLRRCCAHFVTYLLNWITYTLCLKKRPTFGLL